MTAIFRVVVDNNRVFNANAIANFHRFKISVLSEKLYKACKCRTPVGFGDSLFIFPHNSSENSKKVSGFLSVLRSPAANRGRLYADRLLVEPSARSAFKPSGRILVRPNGGPLIEKRSA
ncbi:hypothetical protein QUB67_15880 [Microcoleus sp. ARI1-A1]|uniref:hypothetical protein n=1 Tax=unclassified Microcoleus TaxID=2642155 RepID=UPI002FD3350D